MSSKTYYPGVSADDGYWWGRNLYNDREYVWSGEGNGADGCDTWLRFPNVDIAQGSTITKCFIRYTARYSNATVTVKPRIYFNDEDTAVVPATTYYADLKALTSIYVEWVMPAFTALSTYDSPEIKAVLQKIIDRPGWASGNALMVLLRDIKYSTYGTTRRACSIDYSSGTYKPELHVEWSTAAAGWTGKVNGVENPAKLNGVALSDIAKINGIE